jgi:hypothetical protein
MLTNRWSANAEFANASKRCIYDARKGLYSFVEVKVAFFIDRDFCYQFCISQKILRFLCGCKCGRVKHRRVSVSPQCFQELSIHFKPTLHSKPLRSRLKVTTNTMDHNGHDVVFSYVKGFAATINIFILCLEVNHKWVNLLSAVYPVFLRPSAAILY